MPSPEDRSNARELSPADLRGILKYVPQWRGHTFVIALNGSVIADDGFNNLMLQLAVLRNLGIRVLIVFGISAQIEALAAHAATQPSDTEGYGPCDAPTLELAIEAAFKAGHEIEKALTQNKLRCVCTNAVRATERGIIKGCDALYGGKVDKIDSDCLAQLMEQEWVPVCSPIAFSRDGQALRLNSDALASELAIALKASKLIFMLPYEGLTLNGQFRLNADVAEIRQLIDTHPDAIDAPVRSKALHAVKTIDSGIPRAHIIDSRIHDGLLMEVFSKVGIGSMIHSNPYSMFRPARKKDVSAILSLTRAGVRDESLRPRSRTAIEAAIHEYHVYEIDDSIIGCFRLTPFPRSRTVELGSVFVHPAYKGRNIGKTIVDFALECARKDRKNRVVALTTQAIPFFRDTCHFAPTPISALPKALQTQIRDSQRNSQAFTFDL